MVGVWIGPYCVDLFCPTFMVRPYVGYVFEIDGFPHDREEKGLKDNMKDEFLFGMKIFVKHIENKDVSLGLIRSEIGALNRLKTPDSNSVRNMMRRVKIETISHHANHNFFSKEIGINRILYRELAELIFRHKRKLRGKRQEYVLHF